MGRWQEERTKLCEETEGLGHLFLAAFQAGASRSRAVEGEQHPTGSPRQDGVSQPAAPPAQGQPRADSPQGLLPVLLGHTSVLGWEKAAAQGRAPVGHTAPSSSQARKCRSCRQRGREWYWEESVLPAVAGESIVFIFCYIPRFSPGPDY